jgi:hypothetical protein
MFSIDYRSVPPEAAELPAGADPKLPVDVARVRADGLDTDGEALRYLRVRAPVGEQLEHLGLARREQLRALDGGAAGAGGCG